MKRFLILSAFLAILPVFSAHAQKNRQKWDDQPQKYEVAIGWASMVDVYEFFDTMYSPYNSIDALYSEQSGPTYTIGGLSAEFGLNFRSWFTLAFNLSASGAWKETYDPLTSVTGRKSSAVVSVMPVARFTWVRKRNFQMYSSIGAGAFVSASADQVSANVALCFVPVGMRFGNKVFGFVETAGGAGCNMQGVRGGIGIKF